MADSMNALREHLVRLLDSEEAHGVAGGVFAVMVALAYGSALDGMM